LSLIFVDDEPRHILRNIDTVIQIDRRINIDLINKFQTSK